MEGCNPANCNFEKERCGLLFCRRAWNGRERRWQRQL